MYILLSHVLALGVLTAAAVSDLLTTEVSDRLSIIGVISGIFFHAAASYNSIDFDTLANLSIIIADPISWFTALGDPLMWSLAIGFVLSLYGWGLYYFGLWGGADAFAMSILGFAAPYGISGPGIGHVITLFISILVIGFVYTIGYALYLSRDKQPLKKTLNLIKEQERRISLEIIGAAIISSLSSFSSIYLSLAYFGFFLFLIFIYRFVKVVQDDMMVREVKVEDLKGGEVLSADEDEGGKIKGITKEEIDSIESETVEIREGVRFIPVFPVALLITDLIGGTFLLTLLFSL